MDLECGLAKPERNLQKHGFDFADAAECFSHPLLVREDTRQGYAECRWIALGRIQNTIINGVFTRRRTRIRMISLRGLIAVNETCTTSSSTRPTGTDWTRIRQMTEADIDYSDSPARDEAFWAEAEWWMPVSKDRLSLRLDHDVITWFKAQGPGYQSRINAVLRAYMHHQSQTPDKPTE